MQISVKKFFCYPLRLRALFEYHLHVRGALQLEQTRGGDPNKNFLRP